jgi:hypothetical protein
MPRREHLATTYKTTIEPVGPLREMPLECAQAPQDERKHYRWTQTTSEAKEAAVSHVIAKSVFSPETGCAAIALK